VTVEGALARRLGTGDAVVIGLGSMIGAGVFSAFAPAAAAAGTGLLIGLGLAAGVAYCNGAASAQLAAQYPTSGGTYVYGRERLGEWWGFLAGWGFVVGKTASCAAMALTFASYAVPGSEWAQRLTALAAVLALTAANYHGITRTAGLARLLVAGSVLALVIVLVAIFASGGGTHAANLGRLWSGGLYGVLQSAGLLFFAFAGYARIATLGEEVRDPEHTIPKAIPLALGITVALYFVVALTALLAAGPDGLAASTAPIATAAKLAGAAWSVPVVRVGAAIASLGALLALIAGIGRTSLAMARNGDLPGWLGAVHPRHRVPGHAELAVAAVVSVLVLTTDLRGAIGFSSFGVLTYYAIANASAYTQPAERRRWPRALNVTGLVACAVLVVTLPVSAVVAGAAVLAVGLVGRLLLRREPVVSGKGATDEEAFGTCGPGRGRDAGRRPRDRRRARPRGLPRLCDRPQQPCVRALGDGEARDDRGDRGADRCRGRGGIGARGRSRRPRLGCRARRGNRARPGPA
jgi:APA family basic amino acid/polyamine antiporter